MRILTGERIATIAESGHASITAAYRTIDFDFGAREAAVINVVEICHESDQAASDTSQALLTLLTMDADQTGEIGSVLVGIGAPGVDMDSQILCYLRSHFVSRADDAAGGGSGAWHNTEREVWDWTNRREAERPVIVRNMQMISDQSDVVASDHLMVIRYQLVELSLGELGYINATRR